METDSEKLSRTGAAHERRRRLLIDGLLPRGLGLPRSLGLLHNFGPREHLAVAAAVGVEIELVPDVGAARAANMPSIVVRGGYNHGNSVESLDPAPDAIIDSLAEFPALLRRAR